jgi:hypothetical protein
MIAALLLSTVLALQAPRTINEIRIHGNHTTPDATVIELAGVKPGDPFTENTAKDIEARLTKSGRFSSIEVVTRSRSLDGSDLSVVILLVERYAGAINAPGGAILNPVRRLSNRPMWLPILDFSDYGFSYGLRGSFVNLTGRGSRLSFPFTWGGQKRAAAEYEHRFGPDRRARADIVGSWMRRENPFYDIDDTRKEFAGGFAYQIARPLRAGVRGGLTNVRFSDIEAQYPWFAAEATLDTRLDPELPREAVYASLRWERLEFENFTPANRLRTDLRGYLGMIGQSVLAVRALHVMSDTPLPPFERVLLGGSSTLRGSRFGFAAGDNIAAGSVELRVPFSSPLSVGRVGFNVFTDVGAAYDRGTKLRDGTYQWGYGAGLFFSATVFKLNLDVATDGKGKTRAHLVSGFRF